eukprot:m.107752 g.107752  ORF g.107752 m.107752 type:complete len:93 (+) comp13333_c0_seq1:414-692(+)
MHIFLPSATQTHQVNANNKKTMTPNNSAHFFQTKSSSKLISHTFINMMWVMSHVTHDSCDHNPIVFPPSVLGGQATFRVSIVLAKIRLSLQM